MITPKLLSSWGACWDAARVTKYFGARTGVTPREVYLDRSVSLDDRLWVLTKCVWYLDESAARYLAIEFAASVTHLAGDDEDQAQHAGLLNELSEIEDLPIQERDAARDAAWAGDAARAAAWAAARAAARAGDAARAAAWAAARAAAVDVAWAAAWDAARAAARAVDAARAAAGDAAWATAWAAAGDAALQSALDRIMFWLGNYVDGWEE